MTTNSDILLLREITRKKFMIYSTQQMYLDKEQEKKRKEEEYQELLDFYEVITIEIRNKN